jgi:hypothetical protein
MTASKIRIGLWGTSRSGKTTFIAMLYQSFLSLHNQWDIQAAPHSPAALAFVKNSFETIFVRKSFPEKTAQTSEYTFIITHKPDKREFELTFIDAPGELYERYYDETSRPAKQTIPQSTTAERQSNLTPQQMFDILKVCDGILMFIDPAWQESPNHQGTVGYGRLLFDILNDLRTYQRLHDKKAPLVALCMTKADGDPKLYARRLPERKACYRSAVTSPTTPVVERPTCEGRCPVFDQIGKVAMRDQIPSVHPHERAHCFLISSIGRIHPNNESNVSDQRVWMRRVTPLPPVFQAQDVAPTAQYRPKLMARDTFEPDSICDPDSIQPFQLLDPIIWMLNNLSAVS